MLLLRTLIAIGAITLPRTAVAADAESATAPPRRVALEEIVVTATRREESISQVPISVTAFSQEMIDQKGIKDFQDVVRFTPGVSIDTSGTNAISIRGISSSGGAGTTGIYIDDTPIQMRALGFNPGRHSAEDFRSWIASRSCAGRRAPCSAPAPKAAPSATS